MANENGGKFGRNSWMKRIKNVIVGRISRCGSYSEGRRARAPWPENQFGDNKWLGLRRRSICPFLNCSRSVPGPSSSHTIGPMAAGLDFRQRVLDLPGQVLDQASGFRVVLLGSLSATGQGHGTDRAVAAGLLGWVPEKVEAGLFSDLLRGSDPGVEVDLCGRKLALTPGDIEYGPLVHDHPHANTLLIELTGPDGPLFEKTYYSVGGGFIQWDGYQAPERGRPRYPYGTMRDLMRVTAERDLTLAEVLIANEAAVFGASAREIHAGLDRIIDVMDAAVTRGLTVDGMLPGPIGLSRKAAGLFNRAAGLRRVSDRMLAKLNAYALAAAEENAAGGDCGHRAHAGIGRRDSGCFAALAGQTRDEPVEAAAGASDRRGHWFFDQVECQYCRGRGRLSGGDRGPLRPWRPACCAPLWVTARTRRPRRRKSPWSTTWV